MKVLKFKTEDYQIVTPACGQDVMYRDVGANDSYPSLHREFQFRCIEKMLDELYARITPSLAHRDQTRPGLRSRLFFWRRG